MGEESRRRRSRRYEKATAPRRYEGFVETTGTGARLPLASAGAPDVVLVEDVLAILDAFEPSPNLFVPLAEAIGAPTGEVLGVGETSRGRADISILARGVFGRFGSECEPARSRRSHDGRRGSRANPLAS